MEVKTTTFVYLLIAPMTEGDMLMIRMVIEAAKFAAAALRAE
jgi:hypothetical protein